MQIWYDSIYDRVSLSVLITCAPRVYVVYKKGNEYDHNGVCQQIVLHGCAGTE